MKARQMKQEDLAGILGTTQSSVSGWINGKYEPAAATVFTVERSLGLEPGTLSRPLGYLPLEPASRAVNVEAAIAQSTNLDEDEKAALTTMYQLLVSRSTCRAGSDRSRSTPAGGGRGRVESARSAAGDH